MAPIEAESKGLVGVESVTVARLPFRAAVNLASGRARVGDTITVSVALFDSVGNRMQIEVSSLSFGSTRVAHTFGQRDSVRVYALAAGTDVADWCVAPNRTDGGRYGMFDITVVP